MYRAAQVAAKTGVGLDDDAAAKDDVGCPFNASTTRNFVPCILGLGVKQ